MKNKYANIAIPGGPDFLLTYEIPPRSADRVVPGVRVVVPFRNTHTVGVVVGLSDKTEVEKIRFIADCPDEKPVFSPSILRLAIWLSKYYSSSVGDALKAALPGGLGYNVERIVSISTGKDTAGLIKKGAVILELLNQKGDMREDVLKRLVGERGFYPALDELLCRDLARIRLEIKKSQRPRTSTVVSTNLDIDELQNELEQLSGNANRQAALLEYLIKNPESENRKRDISSEFGAGTVRAAIDKGWISPREIEIFRFPRDIGIGETSPRPEHLTPSQKKALVEITRAVKHYKFETFLLWGVTGSGKTEVYLKAAEKARSLGRGVILLVPEIALTPLLWGRFEQRFPGEVAVLHSGLRPGERFDAWRRLASGQLNIALGPRSAIFAPVQNPGLIIVDEEHETSYKQDEPPPYYNARDVAVMRGSIEGCPVVLGTATPSAESYYNAMNEKYRLLRLPERVPGAELPGVRIVDMTEEREEGKNFSPFSRLLSEKIIQTTTKGHRTMLLLNRRGFSSYLQCPDCGYIPTCEACGIGMTYHSSDRKLKCHYCGAEEKPPDVCPNCRSAEIKYRGHGTQRIEEELEELVPPEKIFRLDADAARRGGHAAILKKFAVTPGAVMVGTQMIAKGHDFPDVALVGVLNADIGLAFPDFRSGEHVFQLLTQVSGRAGRSEIRGEVIIQTYRPDSPAVDFSVNGDVESFFETELKAREELQYPPFSRIVRIIAHGKNPADVRTAIFILTRELARIDREGNKYRLLGPSSCPLSKLRGEYRWHLILKTQRLGMSVEIVKRLLSNAGGGKVSFKTIIDPLTLL